MRYILKIIELILLALIAYKTVYSSPTSTTGSKSYAVNCRSSVIFHPGNDPVNHRYCIDPAQLAGQGEEDE